MKYVNQFKVCMKWMMMITEYLSDKNIFQTNQRWCLSKRRRRKRRREMEATHTATWRKPLFYRRPGLYKLHIATIKIYEWEQGQPECYFLGKSSRIPKSISLLLVSQNGLTHFYIPNLHINKASHTVDLIITIRHI